MFDTRFTKMSATKILDEMTFADVRGVSKEDVKAFKAVIYKLDSMANKRRARLIKSGAEGAEKLRHFSAAGVEDVNQLKRLWRDVTLFLKDPWNSLSGRRKQRKTSTDRLLEMMEKGEYGPMSEDDWRDMMKWFNDANNYDKLWRMWSEIKSRNPNVSSDIKYEIVLTAYKVWDTKEFRGSAVTDMATAMESLLDAIEKGYENYFELLKDWGIVEDDDFSKDSKTGERVEEYARRARLDKYYEAMKKQL